MPTGFHHCDLQPRPNSRLQKDRTCTGHNMERSILSSRNHRVDSGMDWTWMIELFGCVEFPARNYDWTDAEKEKNEVEGMFLQFLIY